MLDPSTPTTPMAQAPPDRPTQTLEQLLNQVRAAIFSDNKLDENEMGLLRGFFSECAQMAQMGGGIGQGAPPEGMDAQGQAPMSPMEMNQNTSDYGTSEGAEPENDDQGGY